MPPGVAFGVSDGADEYPETTVVIDLERVALIDVVANFQDWCEQLNLVGATKRHLFHLGRLTHLKSLNIQSGSLDAESLLQISKLRTLEKLNISSLAGRVTEQGWLQLTKLTQLEYLKLPFNMLPEPADRLSQLKVKEAIKRLMPQTIVE